MAKKLQRQGQRDESAEARTEGPAIEAAAEAATAVAEHEGSATAPIARIGPDEAATPPALLNVDPLDAAAARRRQSREDAVHELRSFARQVASGQPLSDAENDRVAELCELAMWTTGMFKSEVTIAEQRARTRRAISDLPAARSALEHARKEHADALRELERMTAELQKHVNLWAGRVAQAEAFIAVAEGAEKELLRSAPEPVRDAMRRARTAAEHNATLLRDAEEKLNNALRVMNDHKDARASVGDGTEEGTRLDALILGAQQAVDEARRNLAVVRERKAEIEAEAKELHALSLSV